MDAPLTSADTLWRALLNGSIACITSLRPYRNADGQVVDFTYTAVNRAAEELEGLSAAAMIGRRLSVLFPGVIPSGLLERCLHTFATGEQQRYEYFYDADGFTGWLDVSIIREEEAIILTYLDVTQSRQTQQRLAQTASTLQSVLNSSQSAIMSFDAVRNAAGALVDFRCTVQNAASRQLLQLNDEQVLGQPMRRLLPYLAEPDRFARYVAAVETGQPQHFKASCDHGGQTGWYDVSVVRRDDGIVLTILDETGARQTEHALRAQTDLLTSIINTSLNGLIRAEALRDEQQQIIDFQVLFTNPAVDKILALPPGLVLGRRITELDPDLSRNGLLDQCRQVMDTGKPTRTDYFYRPAGRWYDVSAARYDNSLVISFIDVTETRKATENLEQFAYVASHDLQEPLRKIQAFGDVLAAQFAPQIGSSGSDIIWRMQQAASRMSVLIRDLLTYSKLTAQPRPFAPVDMQALLGEVLNDLDMAVQEKKAHCDIGPLPTVWGDAVQLRQLFQNLLSNALKFTRPGHPPHIRVSGQPAGQRDLSRLDGLLPNRSYALIRVSDNGIGIDTRHLSRIFAPFQRLHSRTHYAGTGIGLSIVRRVLDNHQGSIRVESTPGEGSHFLVALPVGAP